MNARLTHLFGLQCIAACARALHTKRLGGGESGGVRGGGSGGGKMRLYARLEMRLFARLHASWEMDCANDKRQRNERPSRHDCGHGGGSRGKRNECAQRAQRAEWAIRALYVH